MPQTLLTTKLFIPPMPASLLSRPRLLEKLQRAIAPENRLVLVSAPAGYGKTTLTGEWLHSLAAIRTQPLRIAWLSLDRQDNDPAQFAAYLFAALQKAWPERFTAESDLAAAAQSAPLPALLSALINLLAQDPQALFIVLDDYQTIHNSQIHEALTFFLDHLSPATHLVVTTRSDPPFPLHRYRARGQCVELRSADLRFTEAEIPPLLQQLVGYSAGVQETALLSERTEGWAAGLQMAALALQGKKETGEFFQSMASSRRYILDYLAEEIFQAQPPAIQRFLLSSAPFERFCRPLCEALQLWDSAETASIFDLVVHSNLFVIPLDADGEWFRYHHLFADLLRLRWKGASLGGLQELHQRAAAWFEANDWTAEAVQHYLQGGDTSRAAALLEQHTVRLLSLGELQRLVHWVELFPPEAASQRPWLRLYQTWAYAFAGKLSQAQDLLEQAQAAIQAGQWTPAEDARFQAELLGLRALLAITSGRIAEALQIAQAPPSSFPPESGFARCAVLWAAGYAWRLQGDLEQARQSFEAVLEISRPHGLLWTTTTAAVDLGAVLRQMGRPRQAEAIYRQALDELVAAGGGGYSFIGRLESFLAQSLYDQNRLPAALAVARQSIAHNRLWPNPNHVVHAFLTLARIHWATGEQAAGLAALQEAEAVASTSVIVPNLRAALESARVRAWLRQGNLVEAKAWCEQQAAVNPGAAPILDESAEQIAFACVRAHLASGDAAAARRILAQLAAPIQGGSRRASQLELALLQAQAAEDRPAALSSLQTALALSQQMSMPRPLLDEGPALLALLRDLYLAGQAGAFLQDLLLAAGELPLPSSASASPSALLTAREMDILRGMMRGLTNAAIGQELYISAGTVKAHSAAIYRKLQAANRTEAIARAKDLKLL